MPRLTHVLDRVAGWLRRGTPAREPVPPGQPADIPTVLARMERLEAALSPGDGVAAFNRMYRQVTELVAQRITEGHFTDPAFMTRLDVVFAALYLDAAAAHDPAQAEPCW